MIQCWVKIEGSQVGGTQKLYDDSTQFEDEACQQMFNALKKWKKIAK